MVEGAHHAADRSFEFQADARLGDIALRAHQRSIHLEEIARALGSLPSHMPTRGMLGVSSILPSYALYSSAPNTSSTSVVMALLSAG